MGVYKVGGFPATQVQKRTMKDVSQLFENDETTEYIFLNIIIIFAYVPVFSLHGHVDSKCVH